ncbi:bifunctional RNase H/acid phosphatase [Phytoactinopolyspora limicola]|uniref:bifunctional RNase H/acid phosphatase n=1 Tax=Phytoactinopolyspora limicola TaxID=2715536 RepID=UPI00140DC498|nr:bifunctional RNase H/acid phosphatase [Phytoactinopolyspora limicola]
MTHLIVEADGGSRGNPGPAAFGALVRSADSGEVLAEVGETIGDTTNNVAEYRGLIGGLRLAYAIDPQSTVEARLDSKLVVEQMSGRWKIKHAGLRPLALEAQRIFPPGRVTYTWVPRAKNTHADRLLNDALDGKPVASSVVAESAEQLGKATSEAQLQFVESAPPETFPVEPAPTPVRNRLAAWSPELGPPTTLILVRHGQTAMTKARRFSGGGEQGPSLDDVGQGQAKRAADFLAESDLLAAADGVDGAADRGHPLPIVVASPMLRTRETAEAIATRLGVADVVVDEQWRECEFGAWEGLTLAEITDQYPDELAAWFSTTSSAPPGGESLDDLFGRVVGARDRTVQRYTGRTVVVVTHSMPVRALVGLTLEAPSSSMFRLQPAPGSVTEIQLHGDGTTTLAGFNHRP